MGYRIRYDQKKRKQFPEKRNRRKGKWLVSLVLIGGLLLGIYEWNRGTVLKNLVFPGDTASARDALGKLVEDIRAGEPFGDAITAFYREIINNAEKS